MANGYEQNYLNLAAGLADCNLAESGARLGLAASGAGLRADFLGRPYLITNQEVKALDGRPVNINNCSLLVHYVLSSGRGAPLESFLPLSRMTGMVTSQKGLERNFLIETLVEFFGADYNKFKRAAEKLNGEYQGLTETGGRAWRFQVLPKIPLKVIFQEADEEFSAELEFLFDRTAVDFIGFECLAFLSACFGEALIAAAR